MSVYACVCVFYLFIISALFWKPCYAIPVIQVPDSQVSNNVLVLESALMKQLTATPPVGTAAAVMLTQ